MPQALAAVSVYSVIGSLPKPEAGASSSAATLTCGLSRNQPLTPLPTFVSVTVGFFGGVESTNQVATVCGRLVAGAVVGAHPDGVRALVVAEVDRHAAAGAAGDVERPAVERAAHGEQARCRPR